MVSQGLSEQVLSGLKACEADNDSLGFLDNLRTELSKLSETSDALGVLTVIRDHLTAEVTAGKVLEFRDAVLSDMFSVVIPFTANAILWPISSNILAAVMDTISQRDLATMIADCLSRAG